ncbi:hypothetical protein [Vibrio sp. LB10LO1]|uniref:hypothetical protein n=1 Tax=Vibrio sp. LB10LO1 TaxID=2711207 RepID=UPI001F081672|nr:hypothetical protein [Vibrio sp. LB10LO1]
MRKHGGVTSMSRQGNCWDMSTKDYSVIYKSSLPSDKRLVSSYSINVIRLALAQAGIKCAIITSTLRFPEEQASIMYRNARIYLKKQKQLYGKNGDAVLDVYNSDSKKDKHEVIRLMKEKIELLARDGKRFQSIVQLLKAIRNTMLLISVLIL